MTRPPIATAKMPYEKYSPTLPLVLEDRTWPSKQLQRAPRWCSVDLRDGNQALIDPMDPGRKLALFEALIGIGIKEVEVGFPSASTPDYEFVRHIIEEDLIPEDVTVQVLVQCRRELIERTFEAIAGAPRAIVHFYNSTSELQRRVVFRQGREGIIEIATNAARLCKKLEPTLSGTEVRYEYSPESFTGTELDFAYEISEAVADVIEPTKEAPLVLNLPSTVEMYSPNVFADVIEWFSRQLRNREAIVLSVHPHNDRGTAVAAAELAMLAGADRLEGTLFGNGERTGNLDLVTVALNLFSQGVDPELDFHDIEAVRRVAEHSTRMPVHPRHPYVGDLVYTAFSGSHQDAIKKGMSALSDPYEKWEVPYLPIDPMHTGRTYEAIIRVNSQSGKGGVAYIMGSEHGLDLPRRLQIEFSKTVQAVTEATGTEIKPSELWEVFEKTYLAEDGGLRLVAAEVTSERATEAHVTQVTAQLLVDGEHRSAVGKGNGPIDALVNALGTMGLKLAVLDYHQHALTAGSGASSVAYVEVESGDEVAWGVGMDSSILDASLQAVISAANRLGT
ncbi:MAG TPA: 2-isopropylmalate synthase [Acidimicrobiales bacterium]|nr:2-isopropylmalate synthase [Acidimicrobiales bacterium]